MIDFMVCEVAINNVFDLAAIVAGVNGVRQAAVYQLESGEAIVAVLNEPIFSLSARDNLINSIKNAVFSITGKQVYVSLDTDIFVAINKCSSDKMAKEIKNAILKREVRKKPL